jgi:hypothetical protein
MIHDQGNGNQQPATSNKLNVEIQEYKISQLVLVTSIGLN